MNTLLCIQSHFFDIFFYFYVIFPFILYLLLFTKGIQTHTHTADTDTHKQTACESTFYIVDRWSVCTRINITFVRSCAGMQTHIHTLCVLKVWWNCKYPVFFCWHRNEHNALRIDKRCVGENVKMIVNGIRDWMYRCHYIGKFFYVYGSCNSYFCHIWYQSVRINEFLFRFLASYKAANSSTSVARDSQRFFNVALFPIEAPSNQTVQKILYRES